MKTLLTFLTLLLPLCLMAQAPPVLRQSLDTNNADIAVTGRSPVWSGVKWVMVDTNTFGSGVTFGDLLWTNVAALGTFFLTPTMAFTNENVAISNLYLLSGGFFNEAMRAEDGGNALQIGPSTLDWPNGVWLNNGRHELVFTNVDAFTSMIIPSDGGFRDDMVYEIGNTNGARFSLIATPNILAGSGETMVLRVDDQDMELHTGNTIGFYMPNDDFAYVMQATDFSPSADGGRNLGMPSFAWLNFYTKGAEVADGITNNGTYQHSVGAFTGALFVSSNANGVAYWTTNIPTLNVTNFSSGGGGVVTNFNRDLNWTNDGTVLRTTLTNPSPPLRVGMAAGGAGSFLGIPQSDYWRSTNVGLGSVGIGSNNLAGGFWGGTLGGFLNEVGSNANLSTIVGGRLNFIDTNIHSSVIGGGGFNRITGLSGGGTTPGPANSVIAGGTNNLIQYATAGNQGASVIGGGQQNSVTTNHAVIGGGFANDVRSDYSTVGGGTGNQIGGSSAAGATRSVIAGGADNDINNGNHVFIGGGRDNIVGGTSISGAYSVIGGGDNNRIAPSATGTATNVVIGGGAGNLVHSSSHNAVIGGGQGNSIIEATNGVISGGQRNTISGGGGSGRNGIIAGGTDNQITGGVLLDHSFIIGNSNSIGTNYVGIIGQKATNNTTPYAITIAPQGETSKTIFTSSNLTVRTSFGTVPDTVVTLTADNQVVNATQRSYVRLASDNATPSNRDFVLTGTNVVQGARLVLEWTDGTNAGQIVDNASNSGGGNTRLSADWVPGQNDTLELIFNGTDWIQVSRADN